MTELPITPLLPRIREALQQQTRLILHAPPGSGKTTLVPPALLDCDWLGNQRILLLEPRRLATRAAAQRMAENRGETVGRSIGYRMRLERRLSDETRVEVVTEGLFTRQLQQDPELRGVGAVLFDEFHERSLDADLGLALALDVQASLRPDLRLLLMSATLDDDRLRTLTQAEVLSTQGRSFPVSVEYLPPDSRQQLRPDQALSQALATALRKALARDRGDLLVFLPGLGEIRQCQRMLEAWQDPALQILPLHGSLAGEEQLAALRPAAAGRRKLILASAVAETSLTIDGVTQVIDAGLARRARYDLRSGMTRLETLTASQASAEQRRGRAGRTGPGHCIRLWSESAHARRPRHADPEILLADLAPLALELAAWGVTDPANLQWLDPPPAMAWQRAVQELIDLDALNPGGGISAHGQAMAEVGLHPRLAHLVLACRDQPSAYSACWLAAVIEDSEALRVARRNGEALDLALTLASDNPLLTAAVRRRLQQSAEQIARRLGIKGRDLLPDAAGSLVALAYPDRIAQLRDGSRHRYRLSNGMGAALNAADPLAGKALLAVAELDGEGADARIQAATALDRETLERLYASRLEQVRKVEWDAGNGCVMARQQRRLGALVLDDRPLTDAAESDVARAMLDGIRASGLQCLPWTDALRQWQARVGWLRQLQLTDPLPPDCSDAGLLAGLDDWLGPWLKGMSRLEHLRRLDLASALHGRLSWTQQQSLRELLPEQLEVPSGSRIRVDYCQAEQPVLAVRLQEMFGAADSPRIAGGRVRLLIHLLSPARRPVQVTSDLASFWRNGYEMVRKELRGRYPKHAWPEDPASAQALRGLPRPRK